jgi:hypothetical protein
MIDRHSHWFSWTLPGVIAIGLSVVGQWAPGATHLAIWIFIPLVICLLLGGALLLLVAGVRWYRGGRALPPLAGLLLLVVAVFALVHTVFEVPRWVKVAAAPALASLERWHMEHGRYPRLESGDRGFPSELRETLKSAGCRRYLPWGDAFQLTCADYNYWSTTQTWSGWD